MLESGLLREASGCLALLCRPRDADDRAVRRSTAVASAVDLRPLASRISGGNATLETRWQAETRRRNRTERRRDGGQARAIDTRGAVRADRPPAQPASTRRQSSRSGTSFARSRNVGQARAVERVAARRQRTASQRGHSGHSDRLVRPERYRASGHRRHRTHGMVVATAAAGQAASAASPSRPTQGSDRFFGHIRVTGEPARVSGTPRTSAARLSAQTHRRVNARCAASACAPRRHQHTWS